MSNNFNSQHRFALSDREILLNQSKTKADMHLHDLCDQVEITRTLQQTKQAFYPLLSDCKDLSDVVYGLHKRLAPHEAERFFEKIVEILESPDIEHWRIRGLIRVAFIKLRILVDTELPTISHKDGTEELLIKLKTAVHKRATLQ